MTCNQTLDNTLSTCRELESAHKPHVYSVTQQLPMLGGAFRTGIARAQGTHIVTMFAGLESDQRTPGRRLDYCTFDCFARIPRIECVVHGRDSGFGSRCRIVGCSVDWSSNEMAHCRDSRGRSFRGGVADQIYCRCLFADCRAHSVAATRRSVVVGSPSPQRSPPGE